MILQEGKHLEKFYGILRDIIYFPDEKVVEIRFYAVLNNDFDFLFRKKYKSEDEMLVEIQDFIKKENKNSHRIGCFEEDLKKIDKNLKKIILAIIEKNIELPIGFEYQGDVSYLKDIL